MEYTLFGSDRERNPVLGLRMFHVNESERPKGRLNIVTWCAGDVVYWNVAGVSEVSECGGSD